MKIKSTGLLDAVKVPDNPFPGLRPFKFHESHLFFGRDGQSERLINKLAATRFLVVVGSSGSGKSSLVRAGLLPALKCGFMANAGSDWRIAVMRPGNDPLVNLARALNTPEVFGSDDSDNTKLQIAVTETTLRLGSRGLIEVVRQNALPATENMLIVVDQFEELFRFAREASRMSGVESERFQNDAAVFVKLLLEACRQPEIGVYIVLSMRSDYLGDCALFWDLPEAVNDGQYLVPRLTRDQLREVITGPIAVAGGEITPRLINRLLNEVGDSQDQLPVLQHALMRTWDKWREEQNQGNPLDLFHHEAIGGMAEALSRHADEAYQELPDDRHRQIAEKLFKRLTEKGEDNREIRRPVMLGEICAVTEATEAEVTTVIESFRHPGRSFLMPPAGTSLDANSLIDISHESLIRVWRSMKNWVEEEAQSAKEYRRLAENAALNREGKFGLLRDPELQIALNWRDENRPNHAWARRYAPDFEETEKFIEKSRQAREDERRLSALQEKRQLRRRGLIAMLSAVVALVMTVLALIALNQKQIAQGYGRQNRLSSYLAHINLANNAFESNNLGRSQELLNRYFPDPARPDPDDLRDFCWYYLWQINHDERETLKGHVTSSVRAVAFSPDDRILASGGEDGTIKLWDIEDRQELVTLRDPENSIGKEFASTVTSIAFSPDGVLLASGNLDDVVNLWDLKNRRKLATLRGHNGIVSSVVFSPDGGTLASGSYDNTVKLWDVKTRSERTSLSGHEKSVLSVGFSPDSKILASGSFDNTIRLWDVESGRELRILSGHEDFVWSVAFSPKRRILASGSSDNTVKLWNVENGRELRTLRGHQFAVRSVALSRDDRTLVSGGEDGTVRLWDVDSGYELTTLRGHLESVNSVAFSNDGLTLVSGSKDSTIKLWDVKSGHEPVIFKIPETDLSTMALSPVGQVAVSNGSDNNIKLWEIMSRQELATLTGHEALVRSMAFSSDGQALAIGSDDQTVKLWNLGSKQELATLKGHNEAVTSMAFSPDDRILASGSEDKMVKLRSAAATVGAGAR